MPTSPLRVLAWLVLTDFECTQVKSYNTAKLAMVIPSYSPRASSERFGSRVAAPRAKIQGRVFVLEGRFFADPYGRQPRSAAPPGGSSQAGSGINRMNTPSHLAPAMH